MGKVRFAATMVFLAEQSLRKCCYLVDKGPYPAALRWGERRKGKMRRRITVALLVWAVLAVLLCTGAGAEEPSLNKQFQCGIWEEDTFDLQHFPARPACFSINEEGTMMVGFQEAGRTKLVLFTPEGVQTVYALVVNSDLQIVLHTDSVTYYTTKDGTAYELKLSDASLRRGSGTDGREIVDALRKADTVSAGDYTLTRSWEQGVYCLRRNGKLVLRCTWWGTWGKELVVAGYAVVLAVVVIIGLLRRAQQYQKKRIQGEDTTP